MLTRNQIIDIVDNVLNKLSKHEEYCTSMTHEDINDLCKMILAKKKTTKSIKQFISAFIYKHAIYMVSGSSAIENNLIRKTAIKRFTNNLNLSYIKPDIYYKYDIKPGKMIMYRWHNKQGRAVDTLTEELAEMGIHVNSDTEQGIFFEFLDKLEEFKPTIVNEVFSKNEIDLAVEESYNYVINDKPFEEKSTNHSSISDENKFYNIDNEIFE